MPTLTAQQRLIALRRAAVRATLAPSVHNTQPWHFELSSSGLDLFADNFRQLQVLDPLGRQLTISCGCALMNARASVASQGYTAHVDRLPDDTRSHWLAHLDVTPTVHGQIDPLLALDRFVELRQTNRRRFSDDEVPAEVISSLLDAADAEGALLVAIRSDTDRTAVATLSQRADELENANPAYRAEMRAWTTDDQHRLDGVPSRAVPRVTGRSDDDIPIRDFDTRGDGWLPAETRSSRNQCLLLLGTAGDSRGSWLQAGEALERVLLDVTRHGFAASPLTQVIEVPATRQALRTELGLSMYPHVLLRVGRAPLTPASSRRRLVDVLIERP